MSILSLDKGGDGVLFTVQRIRDDISRTKKKEEQYRFNGFTPTDDDACIWLSKETAERQFARIGVTRESIIGQAVLLSRTADGYYDINLPNGALNLGPERSAPTTRAAAAPAPVTNHTAGTPVAPAPIDPEAIKAAKREAWTREKACFDACLSHVLKSAPEKFAASNVEVTADAVATLAAALFRSVTDREICS